MMLSLKGLNHTYAAADTISFKDWDVAKGENWLLLGNSGSGKTTLLHIITGIMRPASGTVQIAGTNIYDLNARLLDKFRGQNIGIIFQRPHLVKSLNVYENVALAQHMAGIPADKARISEVLESLGLGEKRHAFADQLSQGQLQRVSIARAVVNKPALLLADEPTSSLDDTNAASVLTLLKEQSLLNNATLIVATHDKRVKDAFSKTYTLA